MAKMIYARLEMEERKQALEKKQNLNLVNDDLFQDQFPSNRDARSTLFGIPSKRFNKQDQLA